MNLKETDKKLLSYLYHNYNEPLSKIAKATKLSRDQVEYRINKYLKDGLIRKFFPVFNYGRLGYNVLAALFLNFEKPIMVEQFIKMISKSKNCISYGRMYGKYDLWITSIFKNEKELDEFISKLFEDESTLITNHVLIKPSYSELYPLRFFDYQKEDYLVASSEDNNEINLDKIDFDILKVISENGMAKLIEIAAKSNISSELTHYHLKKLKEEKIILGNRIQFDMSKLGYFFSLVVLSFRNFSNENKMKIKKFVKNSKNVNSLNFNMQRPNCVFQLFYEKESEIRKCVEEVKVLFKDEPIDIEVLQIGEDEEKIRPLPFLN